MRTPLPVDRRRNLSDEEFTAAYGRPGIPVVIEDLATSWPAASRWTPSFFRSQYGHLRVTVGRAARKTELPVKMTLDEYVRYMQSTTEERPWYLTSWDFTVECPELLSDFTLPRYFAEDFIVQVPIELRPRLLWIFMGPPGSGFRLHVDVGHTAAWNAQLSGRKEWVLFEPEAPVYDGRPDAFNPDLTKFPRMADAQPYVCTLGPGDVIFTPSRWWHQTRILETSMSVTGNYCNDTNLEGVLRYLRASENEEMIALANELEKLARSPTALESVYPEK